jgi:hypothetical protein
MGYFDDIINKTNRERGDGAKRYQEHDSDLCMICHARGGDMRSFFISMFYALSEVAPEFVNIDKVHETIPDFPFQRGYYLRICKTCRGEIMQSIKEAINSRRSLRDTPKDSDGEVEEFNPARNIPVRMNGRTVMMTPEEYDEWRDSQND